MTPEEKAKACHDLYDELDRALFDLGDDLRFSDLDPEAQAKMLALQSDLCVKHGVTEEDCEITPKRDINGITAITAGRFISNLIGKAVRAGYFD